jgi:hypothetical protein
VFLAKYAFPKRKTAFPTPADGHLETPSRPLRVEAVPVIVSLSLYGARVFNPQQRERESDSDKF